MWKGPEPRCRYCDKCGAPSYQTQRSPRQIEDVMRKFLDLAGSPVGVKLVESLDELPSGVEEIDSPQRHCEMVQRARIDGHTFYAALSKHQCKVAATEKAEEGHTRS